MVFAIAYGANDTEVHASGKVLAFSVQNNHPRR